MILSLSNLSESVATSWLGVSEITLMVFAVILTVGLVGEWPDSESWKRRKLYKFAKLAVVLGVVGELVGDAGIFETSARIGVLQHTAIEQANIKAATAEERAAGLEKDAAQLRIDLERERVKTAARPWTKEQFDAIQEIKGTVTDVGILWPEHCIECEMLGDYIASALHSAGAQIHGAHGVSDYTGTGIYVRLPVGSDLNKHPLIVALGKAGLNPMSVHHIPQYSKIRTDLPVIFVGERVLTILAMPYEPPGTWTPLPIEKQ